MFDRLPLRAFVATSVVFVGLIAATPAAAATKPDGKPEAKPGAEAKTDSKWSGDGFAGLEFRSIGPAVVSGRIIDLVVDPEHRSTWYVAVASGGVWKTTNAGTTWESLFDGQASFSTGAITLDPNDSNVVWVGSGENNSQRSVSYGDGVYKSEDGGKSWTNMGLKKSLHIGKILVDPRDSKVVYVAAQGPVWAPGGDRGLYKTTDGGKTWNAILTISENTGVNDVLFDPRNPDVLYASAWQRRRHVWTLISGGPEGGIHKSTDAGKTWKKLDSGLPKEDIGRIGLAVSPQKPDVVYAWVDAANRKGGVFRSTDRGATWSKMSDYQTGAQYYQEIFTDPRQFDRLYAMDTYLKVSDDGGKSWRNLGERYKHVDNHVIWIDPTDNDHYLVGCDGGLYESFDRAATWKYFTNLPITQFYRVTVDDRKPFYYVHGGTQDNETLAGPSRSLSHNGVFSSDWFVTQGGDGFVSQVDPTNPDIIYAESQHGGLTRYDRKSGEYLAIQAQEGADDAGLRWNWDSPLLISPHSPARLYHAANKVYRSDDRGASWTAISPDLSRQIDRNKLPVMGRVWSIDALAKNSSTSFYGNIVSFDESRKVKDLLYVGTDDGLIQVAETGGGVEARNWRREEKFPGVPDRSYVSDVLASRHDADVVYATFDNHKMGDFKPYVLRSTDRGRTWSSVAGDLPDNGTVYTVVEDPVDRDLLFVGTEFGVYFSRDAVGKTPAAKRRWVQLKGGLPPIAVRDIAIQEREKDLVLATFGRGFYILDDYSLLRGLDEKRFDEAAFVHPPRPALAYIERTDLGLPGKGFFGETFYTAQNPPFGATFTYYVKDSLKTLKKARQEAEKKLVKDKKDVEYPTWDALRSEAAEEEPALWLTIRDTDGNVVRRIAGSSEGGIHRTTWDLRYPSSTPTSFDPPDDNPFSQPDRGPLAAPGSYTVSISQRVLGKESPLGDAQSFQITSLGLATLGAADQGAVLAFQRQVSKLQRAATTADAAIDRAKERVKFVKKAIEDTPASPAVLDGLRGEVRAIETRLRDVERTFRGDRVVAGKNEPTPPSLLGRINNIVGTQWESTQAPTGTSREQYDIAARLFADALTALKSAVEGDLERVETALEKAGGPGTPGRLPTWP
jgi:photosystem II stability/assembly factor-like uncharacterized protein